jgi:hypothetical protein
VKNWEKDDKRRRLDEDNRRKALVSGYYKALMSHREDFFKFHKAKRAGTMKSWNTTAHLCNPSNAMTIHSS